MCLSLRCDGSDGVFLWELSIKPTSYQYNPYDIKMFLFVFYTGDNVY